MSISQKELEAMLQKNPNLKVRKSANQPPMSAMEFIQDFARSPVTKYKNQKVFVYEDGFIFRDKACKGHGKVVDAYDSIKEFVRWKELLILERRGSVREVKRQVKLVIQEAFSYRGQSIREISYVADATYYRGDEFVVEDVKAFCEETKTFRTTPEFNLKWKLLKARYPEYVFEIY